MQSKNHQPTAAQKRWHSWVRDNFPACSCGAPATELHHILGSSAKENRIWIGQWAVRPLCYACNHDDTRLPSKVQQLSDFVLEIVQPYWLRFRELPFDADTLMAIQCWRR